MDALKFLKTAKRMCAEHDDSSSNDLLRGDCSGCVLLRFCVNDIRDCPDSFLTKIVNTAEQYNKDHPAKETRKDRLLRSLPNSPINANGDPDLCPEDYGEDNYYDNGLFPCEIFNSDCATCKHEYWSEEPHGPAYWDKYWKEDYGR